MTGRCVLVVALCLLSGSASAQIFRGDTPPATDEPPTDTEVELEAELEEEAPEQQEYRPLLHIEAGGFILEVPFSLSERVEGISSTPVDREFTDFSPDAAFNTQIRVGAMLDTTDVLDPAHLSLHYEHDLFTGVHEGGFERDPDFGLFLPQTEGTDTVLRHAYARIDAGDDVHFMGGFMTSHWGLGLIANDGAHGWTPGSARFTDPREGDRVIRALSLLGPFGDLGLAIAVGADQVERDQFMLSGDNAEQLLSSITLGYGQPNHVGVYGVLRRQTASDDAFLDIQAVDLAGAIQILSNDTLTLTVATELVYAWGDTSLGPTADFPRHDVRQFGGVLRTSADFGNFGAVLDVLYASGDDNRNDDSLNGFVADENFDLGLLLFPYLMSAHSGRSVVTAFDPEISGLPTEDLDRLPSRGGATNTLSFFPRGWWRPIRGLEVYGGPLFALTAVDLADPFNSHIAGGDPRNAFDAEPGGYLGTEIDLGVRYLFVIVGMELSAALEGAVLFPGSAFQNAVGEAPDSILGGRAILKYRF